MAVGFHGYLVVVVMAGGVLCVTRELGEDGERLLQFDHFTIQDVMADYKHRNTLVEESRATFMNPVNVPMCADMPILPQEPRFE